MLKDNHKDTIGNIHAILGAVAIRGAQPASLDSSGGGRITFRRADTEVDLYVRMGWDDLVEDKDGSMWSKITPVVEVSYQSHSNKNPATVLVRAALITEVALLAAEIQATLPEEVFCLRRTADQVARNREQAKWNRNAEIVKKVVEQNVKGMRAGKILTFDRTEEMTSGWYNIGDATREYAVVVDASQVTIARVS